MSSPRLSPARLLAYAAPALPLAVLGLPLYVHLPAYYASALAPAVAGAVLLGARVSDVVTDPLVGWLSDRLPGHLPRRKLLMVVGLPLLLLSIDQLLRPPAAVTVAHFALWSVLVYLGWTLVALPYTAWGAELSDDYHERTRITMTREAAVILGTVVAVVLPVLLATSGEAGEALAVLAVFLWVALPLALLPALLLVPDHGGRPRQALALRAGLQALARNTPAQRLLVAHLLNSFANALPATLFLFYVGHVLLAPEHSGMLLLAYFLSAILALPLWWLVARRRVKQRVWAASIVWAALVFSTVPLLGPGDIWPFALICVLSGVSVGADVALPASILADVVDRDAELTDERRSGVFFGLWSMVTKLSLALAAGIALPLLEWRGFDPTGVSSPQGIGQLVWLYAAWPVCVKLPVAWLVWRLRVDGPAAPLPHRS